MKKEKLLKSAINFRKEGYSLREISQLLNISKSSASIWLKDIKITKEGKERLKKINKIAIEKAKITKKEQRTEYFAQISKSCSVLKNKRKFSKNDYKIFLALLYWAEGSKKDRRLVFMNSDSEMIKAYLFLLRKSFSINEKKLSAVLHLHSYHNRKEQLKYWSKITGIKPKRITIYNKPNQGIRKNKKYQGCISIRYGDVKILDELFLIINRFINNVASVG